MELPTKIKKLYRHWPLHTTSNSKTTSHIPKEIHWFINERINIWAKKNKGTQPPYTEDSVLSQYRFCNIFRELDRQTIEIHTALKPLCKDFPLWLLNMFYERMVARPETVSSVGFLSYKKENNRRVYKKLMEYSRPRYGVPYVFPISVIQRSNTPTRELFITEYLPSIMKKVAKEIQTWNKMSVYEGRERIIEIFGFNLSFLWTEVFIDVAYQYPQHIDLFKHFPIGPGATPTFRKLDGQDDPSVFVEKLATEAITTNITYNNKPLKLSAENWEGIGCEYRKYTNLKKGKGRKRIYAKD